MNYLSEPQQYTATENHLAISDLLLVKLNAIFGFLYFDGSHTKTLFCDLQNITQLPIKQSRDTNSGYKNKNCL